MGYPDTFEGFMIEDQKKWTEFKKQEFRPKPFGEYDIDIRIECCGVCGSDVHTINGGWGKKPLPLCVGHEVVGHAVRIGDKVSSVRVGDRVGVGAQIWSCRECKPCKTDNENYCPKQVSTYAASYPDGIISQGGYSSHIRAHEYFTFPIPEAIPSYLAAPMLCAGLTVYSALVRGGAGPGKNIAIIGMGGLGHFAVMFSAALGAETYVISHSPNKKEDALNLGAKEFILSSEKNWAEKWSFQFDFILNSADMTHKFNMEEYMSTLAVNGVFHNVGMPDEPLPQFRVQHFMRGGTSVGASHIGSRPEVLAMLKLAAEKQLKPMVETIDISAKGCREAVEGVTQGKAKYRFTLVNYDKAFGQRECLLN